MFLSNLAHLDIFFQTLKTEIFSLLIKKTINEKYQFSHEEESIIFFDKESNKKICFDLDNNNPLNVIEEIEQFFKCCYIPGKGLYYDNFLELLISDSRIYFIDGLSTQFEHFYGEQEHSSEEQIITSDKIFFEIGGL
ncbi:hypothetical protein [Dolichospermum sp. UHCC 0259]|uniref:hypothetical protein n=1 Tax=Dolichospermum sp. UHCC 0259 TaxID=2590010 RepID=UPI0014460B4E|nr:hypothetical protein [Dolichospermum sp. UHCC 0259]MTJ48921.1 hypothetical protein [Dolichospermum sp. UHCC 0259]